MAKKDFGIFVPRHEENKYCDQSGFQLTREPTGAVVIQSHREEGDVNSGSIRLSYRNEGSFYDPTDLRGRRHFYEHLFATHPLKKIGRYTDGCNFNADTGLYGMNVYVSGVANMDVKSYGIWPALKIVREALEDPLGYIPDFNQALKREIGVIMGEVRERDSSHGHIVNKAVAETIFSPDNPILIDTLGNRETLSNIEPDGLVELARTIYKPSRLVMSIHTEGKMASNKALLDEFSDYLTTGEPTTDNLTFDVSFFDRINPQLQTDHMHVFDTGLNNGLITLNLVWILNQDRYSVESSATSQVIALMNKEVFSLSREMGLGYSAYAYSFSSGEKTRCVLVGLNFPTNNNVIDFAEYGLIPEIENAILRIKGETIDFQADQINQKQKAVVVSRRNRIESAITGIIDDGKIINAEAMKYLDGCVRIEHLNVALDQILHTSSVKILVGDLRLRPREIQAI